VEAVDREARVQLVKKHLEGEDEHDLDKIMSTWGRSPRMVNEALGEEFVGHDAIREHYRELYVAFPDITHDITEMYVTDNAVILEVVAWATHLGTWRGMPPLGLRFKSNFCVIYRFDDEGMLELEHVYYDKAVVLEQLKIHHDPQSGVGRVIAVATPPFVILRGLAKKLRPGRSRG
jgi:steroid delta-isomerase-like uncharacterized protein